MMIFQDGAINNASLDYVQSYGILLLAFTPSTSAGNEWFGSE